MNKEIKEIVKEGCCSQCGACVALDKSGESKMIDTKYGPFAKFSNNLQLPSYINQACPSIGIHYPNLYKFFYKKLPENWLLGSIKNVRTGYASNPEFRNKGSSGGVITQTLIYLLEKNLLMELSSLSKNPNTRKSQSIYESVNEIIDCSQSIYIPVSMLDILKDLRSDERYAMTAYLIKCLIKSTSEK